MSEQERPPGPEDALHTLLVPAGAGRLDAVLAAGLGVSRARARRLLARGAVSLGERVLRERDKGSSPPAGSRLRVRGPVAAGDEQIRPAALPGLRLLAEGPGWLGYDKPAGVAVHPFEPGERGTVLNDAVRRRPEIAGKGLASKRGEGASERPSVGIGEGGLRSGVVHRLDVDTSGVQLVASDEPTWRRLRAAFESGAFDKRYRAIVVGDLARECIFEGVLVVTRHRPARVSVRPDADEGRPGARRVWQHIRVIERFGAATLVEVQPRTGYLHQIRATLSHLGHPVAGDARYGAAAADPTGASRQLLHAASLRGEGIELTAPDPEDLLAALELLRERAKDT